MKYYKLIFILSLALVSSCFNDKGNYDYAAKNIITIDNIPENIEVMGDVERIKVNPKITSSLDGEIKEDNPNYEVIYYINKTGYTDGSTVESFFTDLNPNKKFNLDTLANLAARSYNLWIRVRDKRTGVDLISNTVNLKIASIIYEGWMVLCNEGANKRTRMDMVSIISANRTDFAYDIMKTRGLPETNNSYCIGYYPSSGAAGDFIFLINETNAYNIHPESFETSDKQTIDKMSYIRPGNHRPVVYQNTPQFNMIVSQDGDAYVQQLRAAGPTFMDPINADIMNGPTTYKVAPFVGVSEVRPYQDIKAIMYDKTNKRFMLWNNTFSEGFIMSTIPNPSVNMLFDYTTAKDMVYMEGTRFSNGTVYALMKDSQGKFSLYGIDMSPKAQIAQSYYSEITATDIDKAKHFAFHSQYPIMYYATDNKVFAFNIQTKQSLQVASFPNEEITMIKFNLYSNATLGNLNNQTDAFMAQQFDLVVATYDSKDAVNGGKFGLYTVNPTTMALTAKNNPYTGFAKIVDIVYRERRK